MARARNGTVGIGFERDGGGGVPLVLVHGITESSATWDPLVPALAAEHTVLRVDLRGHGSSDRVGPYDLGTFATDVHAAIGAAGLRAEDCVLVGHSLGGTVVTAFAAAFPCRAVVNVDQPLALAGFQDGLRQLEPLLRGDDTSFRQAVGMVFDSMRGTLDPSEAARVEAIRRPDQAVVLGVWSAVLDSSPAELESMVDAVSALVRVPYLAIHGIDPGPGYEAWLTARIPTAVVEVWDGLGHYPHLVELSRFRARLREFVAALD